MGGVSGGSIGPVWGAAIAGLVELALLLHAAGLATLTWSALKTRHFISKTLLKGMLNNGLRIAGHAVCWTLSTCVRVCVPVRPGPGGGAAAGSVVAGGRGGCGGRGLERSLQGLLQG